MDINALQHKLDRAQWHYDNAKRNYRSYLEWLSAATEGDEREYVLDGCAYFRHSCLVWLKRVQRTRNKIKSLEVYAK